MVEIEKKKIFGMAMSYNHSSLCVFKCYLLHENNSVFFSDDPSDTGILYLSAAYLRRILAFEIFFITLSVSTCFQTYFKTCPRNKMQFYLFWSHDSRVIIGNNLTSF